MSFRKNWLGRLLMLLLASTYAFTFAAPSIPSGLTLTNLRATSLTLSWTASAGSPVAYEVFKDFASIGETQSTSISITGLEQVNGYQFTVRARDAANNWSAQSGTIYAVTWRHAQQWSGTLYAQDNFDDDGNYINTDYSTDSYEFWCTGPATVYSTGASTRAKLDDCYGTIAEADGFDIAFNGNNRYYWLDVTQGRGDYMVYVDMPPPPNQAPTANFTLTPAVGRAPLTVTFDGGTSSDPDGRVARYYWDLANNVSASTITCDYTYPNTTGSPISYSVRLGVTDNVGAYASTTRNVLVYPQSSAAINVSGGTVNQPYQTPGGTVTLAAGVPPAGKQFDHWIVTSGGGTLVNASSPTANLTVGASDTTVEAVWVPDTVPPLPPQNYSITNQTAISLKLSWSGASDNSGVTGYEVFKNGMSVGQTTEPSLDIADLDPATLYQFTVRAVDFAGNWSAPSMVFRGRTWSHQHSWSGQLLATDSYDDAGNYVGTDYSTDSYGFVADTGPVKVYTTGAVSSGIVKQGDVPFGIVGEGRPLFASYTATRMYYEVDLSEGSGPYMLYCDIPPENNQSPVPSLTPLPAFGRSPVTVSFDGRASWDPDGSIAGYAWDFTNSGHTDATGSTTSHTYSNAGTLPVEYYVRLTVTDDLGASASCGRTIMVFPANAYAVSVSGGAATIPFVMPNGSTTINAARPAAGMAFQSWTLVSASGVIVDPNAKSTTVIGGSGDVVVKANFAPDISPPTVPSSLVASNLTSNSAKLSWHAATDNVEVVAYEIYDGTRYLATTSGTSFVVTNLAADTLYQFNVRAVDGVGLRSAPSGSVAATTWRRVLVGSGTITTDDEGNGSSASFQFNLDRGGTVRLYTTGTTATRGTLAGPIYFGTVNGNGGNFDFTQRLSSGAYTITVSGQDGFVSGDFQIYADFGLGLQADFTATPDNGSSPLVVTFNASKSWDPNGDTLASYIWDFDSNGSIDATGPIVSHTFGSGVFTVKLSIITSGGDSASVTRKIVTQSNTIGPWATPSPGATIPPPGPVANPVSGRVGTQISLSTPAADSSGAPFIGWSNGIVEDVHNRIATMTISPWQSTPIATYWPTSGTQPVTTYISNSKPCVLVNETFEITTQSTAPSGSNLIWDKIDYSTDYGQTWVDGTLAARTMWQGFSPTHTLVSHFSFANPGWVYFRGYATKEPNGTSFAAYTKVLVTTPGDGDSVVVINGTAAPAGGPEGTVISLTPAPALSMAWWELISGAGTFSDPFWPWPTFTKGSGPAVIRANAGSARFLTVKNGHADKLFGASGTECHITADVPPSGKVFDHWSITGAGSFANPLGAATVFVFADSSATIEAIWRAAGAPTTAISTSAYYALRGDEITITATTIDSDNNLISQSIDWSLDDGKSWIAGTTAAQAPSLSPTKWQGSMCGSNTLSSRFVFSSTGRYHFRASACDNSGNASRFVYTEVVVVFGVPITTLVATASGQDTVGSANGTRPPVVNVYATEGANFTVGAWTASGSATLSEQQIDLSRDGGSWSVGTLGNGRLWTARDCNNGELLSAIPFQSKTFAAAEFGPGVYLFRARAFDTSKYSEYQYIAVNVLPATAPIIVAEPVSASVNAGDAVTFAVVASGSGTLAYQWRKNGQRIENATTSSLHFDSAQESDAGDYTVVVSNDDGTVSSAIAHLAVRRVKPLITSSLNASAIQGQPVTYNITATGPAGYPISYTASGLPAGLSVNGTTGTITGTTTAFGTLSSLIRATNSYGYDEATLAWAISPAAAQDGTTGSKDLLFPETDGTKDGTLPTGWPNRASSRGEVVAFTNLNFSVNASGEAVAAIPIATVSGVAGMEPKISLVYNHNAANGYLGVGWSIQGVSMITRRIGTLATDGAISAVNLDSNDRFALDGQRLVFVGNGTSPGGTQGAEFRTEIESFSRIFAIAPSSGTNYGPERFELYSKAGVRIDFGQTTGTTGSRIMAGAPAPSGAVLAWAVDTVTDRDGNACHFYYAKDANTGEFNIESIRYGPDEKARLSFTPDDEGRPDVTYGYIAGAPSARTKRLGKIEAKYDGVLMRRYILRYETSPNSGRSRLRQVQEYDADGSALPATTFAYNDAAPAGWAATNDQDSDARFEPAFPLARMRQDSYFAGQTGAGFVDVDGDGIPDFLHRHLNVTSTGYAARGSVTGWNVVSDFTTAYCPRRVLGFDLTATDLGVRFVDLNSDGYPDVISARDYDAASESRSAVFLNGATGWSATENWVLDAGKVNIGGSQTDPDRGVRFVDLDGDGRVDVIWSRYESRAGFVRGAMRNTGAGWGAFPGDDSLHPERSVYAPRDGMYLCASTATGSIESGVRLIDINGDGLPDMIANWPGVIGPKAYINTGHGWVENASYAPREPVGYSAGRLAGSDFIDLNGDGLPDQVVYRVEANVGSTSSSAYSNVWLNTGRGWAQGDSRYRLPPGRPLVFSGTLGGMAQIRFGNAFVDVNGDGLPDLVSATSYTLSDNTAPWQYPVGSAVYRNTGNGWVFDSNFQLFVALASVVRDRPGPDTGMQVLDVNGDGMPDIVGYYNNPDTGATFKFATLNLGERADLLDTITQSSGLQTKVAYGTLGRNDDNFYTRGSRANASGYPVVDVQDSRYVVKQVTECDGIGGTYDLSYHYTALRQNLLEGSLGFESVKVTDSRTSKSATTYYRQEYPYIGQPWKVESARRSGRVVSRSTTTWASKATTTVARVQFPYPGVTEEQSFDPDSGSTSPYLTKTDAVAKDGANHDKITIWGDVWDQSTEASDGYAGSTTRTITYATAATAFPGQMEKEVVKTTGATQSPLSASSKTRTLKRDYDTSGHLTRETREPLLKPNEDGSYTEPTADELTTYLATDDAKALYLTTSYQYDTYGHIGSITVDGPGLTASRSTSLEYSADYGGRFLTKKTNAAGHTETFSDFNLPLGVAGTRTDVNGLSTTFTYDGLGRVASQTAPGAVTTEINRRWVENGQGPALAVYHVETLTDGAPPSLVFFDALSRPIRAVGLTPDSQTTCVDTIYDNRGNAFRQSRPYAAGTSESSIYYDITKYDDVGRVSAAYRNATYSVSTTSPPIETITAGSGYSTFTYSDFTATEHRSDVATQPTASKSHLRSNVAIAVTHNSLSGVAQIVESGTATTAGAAESLTATISYEYDGFGALVQIKDPINATTQYTVDAYGRRTVAGDPNRGTWTFRYNPLGEVVTQTDANRSQTSFTYDGLGRPLTRTIGTLHTSWIYDSAPGKGKGQVASITSFGALSESFEYDNYGALSKSTRSIGTPAVNYVRIYGYDAFRRLKTTAHRPDSTTDRFVERRVYGAYGHWVALRNDTTGGRYWLGTSYEADGQVKSILYGNGVITDRTHLPHDGVVDSVHTGLPTAPDGVQNLHFFYEPDRIGSLYKRIDRTRHLGESFVYDALGRVRSSYRGTIGGDDDPPITGETAYAQSYDLAGNLLSKFDVADDYNYTRPAGQEGKGGAHAIKSIGSAIFVYDDNGNLTNDGSHSIAWNVFNQPESIARSGAAASIHFDYDSGLQRLRQIRGAETTLYLGAGHERRTTDSIPEDVHYLSGPLGQMGQVTWRNGAHADVRYFHHDHLGSIAAITKLDGTAEPQSYNAWGERRDPNTWLPGFVASTERRGFTEHEHLDDVRLIHMNGRVYDPHLGRFISVDPVFDNLGMTQGVNAYSYVRNNPLSFTDPTGLSGPNDWADQVVPLAPVRVSAQTGLSYASSLSYPTFANNIQVSGTALASATNQPSVNLSFRFSAWAQGYAQTRERTLTTEPSTPEPRSARIVRWIVNHLPGSRTLDRLLSGDMKGARQAAWSEFIEVNQMYADIQALNYVSEVTELDRIFEAYESDATAAAKSETRGIRFVPSGDSAGRIGIPESLEEAGSLFPRTPFKAPIKTGQRFVEDFTCSKGTVEMAGKVIVDGRTLILDDFSIFPNGAARFKIGNGEVLNLFRTQLGGQVRALGFDRLELRGLRVSGANQDRTISVKFDLTK